MLAPAAAAASNGPSARLQGAAGAVDGASPQTLRSNSGSGALRTASLVSPASMSTYSKAQTVQTQVQAQAPAQAGPGSAGSASARDGSKLLALPPTSVGGLGEEGLGDFAAGLPFVETSGHGDDDDDGNDALARVGANGGRVGAGKGRSGLSVALVVESKASVALAAAPVAPVAPNAMRLLAAASFLLPAGAGAGLGDVKDGPRTSAASAATGRSSFVGQMLPAAQVLPSGRVSLEPLSQSVGQPLPAADSAGGSSQPRGFAAELPSDPAAAAPTAAPASAPAAPAATAVLPQNRDPHEGKVSAGRTQFIPSLSRHPGARPRSVASSGAAAGAAAAVAAGTAATIASDVAAAAAAAAANAGAAAPRPGAVSVVASALSALEAAGPDALPAFDAATPA